MRTFAASSNRPISQKHPDEPVCLPPICSPDRVKRSHVRGVLLRVSVGFVLFSRVPVALVGGVVVRCPGSDVQGWRRVCYMDRSRTKMGGFPPDTQDRLYFDHPWTHVIVVRLWGGHVSRPRKRIGWSENCRYTRPERDLQTNPEVMFESTQIGNRCSSARQKSRREESFFTFKIRPE